jgi:hypothetical protein
MSERPEAPTPVLVNRIRDDMAAAIGRVIAAWAMVERDISDTICDVAGINREIGACITAQLNTVSGRLDALTALSKLLNASAGSIKKLNRFKERARILADRRNRIAHDPWLQDIETSEHYRFEVTARSRLVYEPKPETLDELNALEEDIRQLDRGFMSLRVDLIFLRPPSS